MATREEQIRAYNARQATQAAKMPQTQQMAQPQQPMQQQTQGGMTPERRAQIEAMVAQQSQPAPQKPGIVQSIVQGVASPFLRTATSGLNTLEGLGNLAQAGFSAIAGDKEGVEQNINEANAATKKQRDFGYFGQDVNAVGQSNGQFKDTAGFAKDVIGTGAEIGSYLAPGAGITRGAQQAAKLGVRAALPTALGEGALLGGMSGVLGGAGAEAQKDDSTLGSIAKSGVLGGLTGAAIGGAIPLAGAAVRGAGRVAGNLGAEVLGRTTGAGAEAIRETFRNPNVVKFARQAGKEGENSLLDQALEESYKALNQLERQRGAAYVKELDKIKLNTSQLDNILNNTRDTAKGLLDEFYISTDEGKLLNNLNFDESTIPQSAQGTVQRAFNDVMKWTDNSAAGLDRLKKKLSQHVSAVRDQPGAQQFVLKLKSSLDNALKENVPGYREMTAAYSQASDIIDDVQKALSLSDNVQKDTAIRKLTSTMRQNNDFRKEMLQILSGTSGADISGKLAGAALSPLSPRGLAGTLAPSVTGGSAIASFLNPSLLPFTISYLATASPRLMAEFVSLFGKFKGTTIPPAVKMQLRNILIQAFNEDGQGSEAPTDTTTQAPQIQ